MIHGDPIHAEPPQSRSRVNWPIWIVGALAVWIFWSLGVSQYDSPAAKERRHAEEAIRLCWQEQQRKSFTPGEQRFIAGACERMDADYLRKYGSRP